MFWLTAVLPIVIAIVALGYARRQTTIAQASKAKLEEQEREVNAWLIKHEEAARKICKITPQQMMPTNPGQTNIYSAVFLSPELRKDIQDYLVEPDQYRTQFIPRKPTELELRSPALRETVKRVTEILETFRLQHPDIYKYFQ